MLIDLKNLDDIKHNTNDLPLDLNQEEISFEDQIPFNHVLVGTS